MPMSVTHACGKYVLRLTNYKMLLGGFALKKQMLDDRRFPKMHLNLQRLLQVILDALFYPSFIRHEQ